MTCDRCGVDRTVVVTTRVPIPRVDQRSGRQTTEVRTTRLCAAEAVTRRGPQIPERSWSGVLRGGYGGESMSRHSGRRVAMLRGFRDGTADALSTSMTTNAAALIARYESLTTRATRTELHDLGTRLAAELIPMRGGAARTRLADAARECFRRASA